jgi:hypothetical protein
MIEPAARLPEDQLFVTQAYTQIVFYEVKIALIQL